MTSVAKRPDGRWRARYRDEAGREHARHFDRKVDAQRWLDETTAAVVTGTYVDPKAGRETFAAYYADWANRQVWEWNTRRSMDLSASSATFADLPLGRLRRSHVEQWVKMMATAGLAPGTIRTRVNNVRSALRAAVRDRVLASDPSEGVALPRDRRRDAAMTLPTSDQLAAVLDNARPEFRAFVALAAFAGLRLGEAAGLQVLDIDFLRRTLAVQRQVQRKQGGGVELRPPKYGSERVVYPPDGLLEMLSEHLARYRPGTSPVRFVFSTADDRLWDQNAVGHYWRTACRRSGVSGLTLHDCRHFYASGLIASGCDVVTVQRALGHAKATTTLNTYAHLWPTAEDRTRRAASDLLTAVVRPSHPEEEAGT